MPYITSYDPLPLTFTHGEGIWLYDSTGKAYLDSFSGIAVCGLGHAHPEVTKTIQEQAARLIHTSNVFHIHEQEALAAKLTSMAGMDQVFFANSGAEANETALKLTRLFGHKKGIEAPQIIVMEKAFHGRTLATLSASGSRRVQAGFEPLVPGFLRVPLNDLEAIKTIAAHRDDVVAVMLEPIQGEGGVHLAEASYLKALAEFCKHQDWMLILDEIQTGNGRTGKLFAYQHHGIKPDVLTTAKGLGNGFPIGACLMSQKANNLLQPGNHGSTFGGNPLACATAKTVLEVIERDKLCEAVARKSGILMDALITAVGKNPKVKSIRGQGFMLGVELNVPAAPIKNIGISNNILLNVTAETVIRLLPAFIITEEEIAQLVERLTLCIEAL